MVRELLGSGSLFDQPLLTPSGEGGGFESNEFMALPASAFFIIGLIIWALRCWRTQQIEVTEFTEVQDRP